MMTIYRERANGRWEFWTYSDGDRVYVSAAFAEREAQRATARIVEVTARNLRNSPSKWRFEQLGMQI